MTAAEFLQLFPMVKVDQSTGGNCTAWILDLHADCYVLITDGIDAYQPDMDATGADFSICRDGESVECRLLTWDKAALWLHGVLDFNDTLNTWGAFNINRKGEAVK